jgi:RNA polymerase sigma-32 factor
MAKKTHQKPVKKSKKSDPVRPVSATVVTDDVDAPIDDIDVSFEEPLEVKSLVPTTESGIVSRDPLVTYLNEIRRYQLLTREQEFELAKKYYETKDPNAAQELIKSNLRFVVKVAAEYSRFGAKMIDLIQEGNVGLMHAVKEFNPHKGARLITYAVWWIRGYIQEYMMKQFSMVKIGTTPNQRKLFYQLQKQKEELEKMGYEGVLALSEKLGIPVDEIEIMQNRLNFRDVSLDKPLDINGDLTLQDVQKKVDETPVDEKLAQNEMIEILRSKIDEIRPHLNEKEKIILEERLLNDEPLTLQEIGEKYKITREAVRQAEVRLMKKIKDRMGVQD